MGDTSETKPPAFSATWANRAVIVAAIAAAFGLGWLGANHDTAPLPTVKPRTTAAPTAQVRLELDPDSLTLLPDGGLHLLPLPSVDPDALYRNSLPPAPAAATPPTTSSGPPTPRSP